MDAEVQKLQQDRLALLDAVYSASGGSPSEPVDLYEVGRTAGLERAQIQRAAEYLRAEQLMTMTSFGDQVGHLTHAGVLEVEKSRTAPEEPTDHFAPRYSIYIGSMHNSSVQQASSGTLNQTVVNAPVDKDELLRAVGRVRESLPALQLDEEDAAEVEAEIATVEAQARSSRTKWGFVKESLGNITRIIGLAGPALGQTSEMIDALEKLHKQLPGV